MNDEKKSYVGIIVLVVVIFSLVALAYYLPQFFSEDTIDDKFSDVINEDSEEGYVFNGFAFVNHDDSWKTRVQINRDEFVEMSLRHGPLELLDIPIEGEINDIFKEGEPIYVTFNPNEEQMKWVTLSAAELGINLVRIRDIEPACSQEHPDCEGREILTCKNTTVPIIYLQHTNENAITMHENCIVIEGNEEGLAMSTDKFIYRMYGIIRE